ncbi:hypothetical protein [Deefgea salmonis]|nr:hypothetical protein [Deefgea salmonis]
MTQPHSAHLKRNQSTLPIYDVRPFINPVIGNPWRLNPHLNGE